ncbi:MAG: COX15/CtaA family protein [Burkholderiaceae bacterium]
MVKGLARGSETLFVGNHPTGAAAVETPFINNRGADRALTAGQRRQVAGWLLVCCAFVMAIIVVGGATRLTRSGLSIVEWQPITGTLPPIGEQAWQEVFQKYQLTPEFRLVNHAMTLDEFKGIFWWEYFHRLLGRMIGLLFALPFVWFLWRRAIERRLVLPLFGILMLGAAQGALGWYMVKSGLVDDPRVSHLRLTAHLGVAVLIFGSLLWVALEVISGGPRARTTSSSVSMGLRRTAGVLTALVFTMILSGAMVAGLRAGYAYNTFPLMHGSFIPPDLGLLSPWYQNLIDNPTTVQFVHRSIAWILIGLLPLFAISVLRYGTRVAVQVRLAAWFLLIAFAVQVTLGIITLVLSVPIPWAIAHQGTARYRDGSDHRNLARIAQSSSEKMNDAPLIRNTLTPRL